MADSSTTVLFEPSLSDDILITEILNKEKAEQLFQFFKECNVFIWKNANNDCEDRANAICILLDQWKVSNCKGWVFSGNFLAKSEGSLINTWNYHVAPLLPVKEGEVIKYYIIDPATSDTLEPVEDWAARVTHTPSNFYVIKEGENYIFPSGKIKKENWHKRNRQNFKWTMQGLAGINGVSKVGKAQIVFNKKRIQKTEKRFKDLQRQRPAFL